MGHETRSTVYFPHPIQPQPERPWVYPAPVEPAWPHLPPWAQPVFAPGRHRERQFWC